MRPAREPQLQTRQHGFEKGIAQAGGCAKEARGAAGHPRDAVLRVRNLRPGWPRTEQRERVPVPLAVIFDGMAAADDFLREIRVTLDALANTKEARASAVGPSCDSTCGVTSGSGPSSMVIATSPRRRCAPADGSSSAPAADSSARVRLRSNDMVQQRRRERPRPPARAKSTPRRRPDAAPPMRTGGARVPSAAAGLPLIHLNFESKNCSQSLTRWASRGRPRTMSTASGGSASAMSRCAAAKRSSRP